MLIFTSGMNAGRFIRLMVLVLLLLPLLNACHNRAKKKLPTDFTYRAFKDSIKASDSNDAADTSNIFDTSPFTPGIDSLDTLLMQIDELWKADIAMMVQLDTLFKVWKKTGHYTAADSAVILENVKVLDSFFITQYADVQGSCREKDCLLFAEIIKSEQSLYLYLDGELIDTFKISTGLPGYETPEMNIRPRGPILKKYTSKKFPGGNFNGLGNMPYVVFVRGGYAIHGTTVGNFSKLGRRASHGCIRLHPVNAKIFYELVKRIGLENTWVSIKDSLQ
ncbi:MAG: L,D-transpeptidase [Ferruginibacter sp.]